MPSMFFAMIESSSLWCEESDPIDVKLDWSASTAF
jgi:hypothetical protein